MLICWLLAVFRSPDNQNQIPLTRRITQFSLSPDDQTTEIPLTRWITQFSSSFSITVAIFSISSLPLFHNVFQLFHHSCHIFHITVTKVVTVVTKVLPMGVPDSALGPMSSSLATAPQLVQLTSPNIPHLKQSLLWPSQKLPPGQVGT